MKETETSRIPKKITVKQRLSSFAAPLKYKIESESETNLTRSRAIDFLEMKSFEGERSVREHHVQFLLDEWAAGRFLWHNVTIAAARVGGDLYRVNGQHTCWMRINIAEKCEPVRADVTERIYIVEDDEQLRNLYSAFDRAAPRTVSHVSKVMMMGTAAGQDIPPSLLGKLMTAFRIYFAEDWNRVNANPNALTGIINQSYAQLFQTVGHFVRSHYEESTYCRRAAVVASMFASFEKNTKAADEFWTPVWSNIGHTSKNDPRYKLRVFIDSHSQSQSGRLILNENRISTETLFRACINCWNHWRAGEDVTTVRTTDKRVPVKA